MAGCSFLGLVLSAVVAVFGNEVCSEDGCRENDLNGSLDFGSGWIPFRIANEDKWIEFNR